MRCIVLSVLSLGFNRSEKRAFGRAACDRGDSFCGWLLSPEKEPRVRASAGKTAPAVYDVVENKDCEVAVAGFDMSSSARQHHVILPGPLKNERTVHGERLHPVWLVVAHRVPRCHSDNVSGKHLYGNLVPTLRSVHRHGLRLSTGIRVVLEVYGMRLAAHWLALANDRLQSVPHSGCRFSVFNLGVYMPPISRGNGLK
eukprot:1983659-Prymnesium_polylepis.2